MQKRRICFVTGSRAEFGLMESTLRAIQNHRRLTLQIIATGTHLHPAHGASLAIMRVMGLEPITIPWPTSATSPTETAQSTGNAMAAISHAFDKLKPHIVLVVGDRVEAFAAAAAAHVLQIPLAHVHGGDRALGQIDDSLRHAITKLSHIHFPATRQSASRIAQMGEDKFRIRCVGSPGVDNIRQAAVSWDQISTLVPSLRQRRYATLLLHPITPDAGLEELYALNILGEIAQAGFESIVIIHPNNDPGSAGILRAWKKSNKTGRRDRITVFENIPRRQFLGLLQHAAVLIGNSSSGIIEAASFGTPVINVGDRQKGRERNKNVIDVPPLTGAIRRALKKVWNNGHPLRFPKRNIYGSGRTSQKIARILATIPLNDRLRRKLITY
jgi:GDP/UDP-N,N'-diacetylbacillosamine 2-epimerase (hydrolysing)